jgi:iron complex transport system substrate-binding protein
MLVIHGVCRIFYRFAPNCLIAVPVFAFYCLCSAACQAVDITDSDGHVISVRQPFSRIISLYPAHTENLFYMGADSKVAGVSKGCQDIQGVAGKPVFSYRDDPERILAARPDLVLVRPMISRAYPAFVEMLRKNGVAVVSLQPVSVDGLGEYWKKLGLLAGREKEADAMWEEFQDEVRKAKQRVSGIPPARRKRVYFESMHRRMKSFARGSIAMFVLETAGGVNAIPDLPGVRNTNIAYCGKERLVANADRIDVYLAQYGRMNRISVDDIIHEPGFGVIKAVRNRQVYLVPEEIVSRPTMRLVQGIYRIMKLLYSKHPRQKIQP